MKIKTIVEGFVDNMIDDMNYHNDNYCIFNTDQIDECIDDDVLEMAKNKADKVSYLEDFPEDRDEVVEDFFVDLSIQFSNKIYVKIIEMMKNLGYDCYEGDFFPCNGYFKSLAPEQIAFIK